MSGGHIGPGKRLYVDGVAIQYPATHNADIATFGDATSTSAANATLGFTGTQVRRVTVLTHTTAGAVYLGQDDGADSATFPAALTYEIPLNQACPFDIPLGRGPDGIFIPGALAAAAQRSSTTFVVDYDEVS